MTKQNKYLPLAKTHTILNFTQQLRHTTKQSRTKENSQRWRYYFNIIYIASQRFLNNQTNCLSIKGHLHLLLL